MHRRQPGGSKKRAAQQDQGTDVEPPRRSRRQRREVNYAAPTMQELLAHAPEEPVSGSVTGGDRYILVVQVVALEQAGGKPSLGPVWATCVLHYTAQGPHRWTKPCGTVPAFRECAGA